MSRTRETQNQKQADAAAALASKALELRNQGLSYQQIGDRLERSPSTIGKYIERGRKAFFEQYFQKVEVTVGKELARLDKLLEQAFLRAQGGDDPRAIQDFCSLLDRKFRALGIKDKMDLKISATVEKQTTPGEIGPETHARVMKVLEQYHEQLEFEEKDQGQGDEGE